MDLMVRDLLQVGQGLPAGRVILAAERRRLVPIQLPGPEGTNYQLDGPSFCPPRRRIPDTLCEDITAVVPGPGRGPVMVDGEPATDMITTLAADSAFESVTLRTFAADGRSITVPLPGVTVVGAANPLHPSGHNISDGPASPATTFVLAISSCSRRARQRPGAGVQRRGPGAQLCRRRLVEPESGAAGGDGTAGELRNTAPRDDLTRSPTAGAPCAALPAACDFVTTVATRIRMISYYIDNVTDPHRPRLVRRMNNGVWNSFDNMPGTAVAFDIEGLQISYDLADGLNNPSNVRMDDDDLDGGSVKCPTSCSPNQIRKVNILLSARSRLPRRSTQQFFHHTLVTQVSLRSLAFVDRYR